MTPFQEAVRALAQSYVGVRETSRNSNPENIDKWLAFCGCSPGDAYCACYVSWCVLKAAAGLAVEAPTFRKSAGALRLVTRNQELQVSPDEARRLLNAGALLIGVMEHAGGKGHAFFVLGFLEHEEDVLVTLEANTSASPKSKDEDREGEGVFLRDDRAFGSVDFWLKVEP